MRIVFMKPLVFYIILGVAVNLLVAALVLGAVYFIFVR
jgi:hypothetical protein